MPTLRERIQTDLAEAMRSRDEIRKATLRMLLAAIKNAEIRTPPAGASDEELARMAELPPLELDDTAVLSLIQKQIKQRRESIEQFQKAGRQDLVEKESAEVAVLERYLPQQASRAELEAAARKAIAETGATSARDLGKVMPILTKEFAGRADGRTINEIVRSLLSG